MRVVADIQAEGLRAAGALLERILGSDSEENGRRPVAPTDNYAALVDAWTELIRRFIAGFAESAPPGAVTVQVGGDGVARPVRLTRKRQSREEVAAEVWLHNGTASDIGPLQLSCGDLRSSKGKRLKRAKVRFEPRMLSRLDSGSSHAVKVLLVAMDEPRPGVYRSTIQAEGAPGLWLPLEVAIEPC
jgi:hypothetical protein